MTLIPYIYNFTSKKQFSEENNKFKTFTVTSTNNLIWCTYHCACDLPNFVVHRGMIRKISHGSTQEIYNHLEYQWIKTSFSVVSSACSNTKIDFWNICAFRVLNPHQRSLAKHLKKVIPQTMIKTLCNYIKLVEQINKTAYENHISLSNLYLKQGIG